MAKIPIWKDPFLQSTGRVEKSRYEAVDDDDYIHYNQAWRSGLQEEGARQE